MASADRPQTALIDYIRYLADLLNLGQWKITINPKPAGDDAIAEVVVTPGQQVAKISVQLGFMDLPAEDIRSAILHELVHVHLWAMSEAADHAAPHLGTVGAAVFEAAHTLANERATDAISLAIAPFFPLPT